MLVPTSLPKVGHWTCYVDSRTPNHSTRVIWKSTSILFFQQGLKIVPILNKIDLKTANIPAVSEEMDQFFDIKQDEIIPVSAKTGQNIDKVLDAIVARLPSPAEHIMNCSSEKPLRTLIFDSSYEVYKGVNINLFVASGRIKQGDRITSPFLRNLAKSKVSYEVKEIGLLRPHHQPTGILYAGNILPVVLCDLISGQYLWEEREREVNFVNQDHKQNSLRAGATQE